MDESDLQRDEVAIIKVFVKYIYIYIMEVGDKLNPQRSYRKGFALKGIRQHIRETNNPSTIRPDELLTVRFPDLKENQLIISGTTKLTFNIPLSGTDANRTSVKNLGRSIIRKLVVKLKSNEIINIDVCDVHVMTVGKVQLRDIILSFKV